MTRQDVLPLGRARWRTSSRTNGGEACVEVADFPQSVAVRDSKNPGGPVLSFSRGTWRSFSRAIKAGDHDLNG